MELVEPGEPSEPSEPLEILPGRVFEVSPIDLYRTVASNQLATIFRYNDIGQQLQPALVLGVSLQQLFENAAAPALLGSFQLEKEKAEAVLIGLEDLPIEQDMWRNENCHIRRVHDHDGLSCHCDSTREPAVELNPNQRIEKNTLYFLARERITEDTTVHRHLSTNPESASMRYDGKRIRMFLVFQLPRDTNIPDGFELVFDNDPHWTIRRKDEVPFAAKYCEIRPGRYFGMVPELVAMRWVFHGITLEAGAEPAPFNPSFDKDTHAFAVAVYAHFSSLSTPELVSDAVAFLERMLTSSYAREALCAQAISEVVLGLIDDLWGEFDQDEFDTVQTIQSMIMARQAMNLPEASADDEVTTLIPSVPQVQ